MTSIVNTGATAARAASWLDNVHLRDSVERLAQSASGREARAKLAEHPTRVRVASLPQTVDDVRPATIASYRPATNVMSLPWQVAHTRPVNVRDKSGRVVTVAPPWLTDEIALTVAHEGVHRLQNAPFGRALVNAMVIALWRAARDAVGEVRTNRSADEHVMAAAWRGAARSVLAPELDAFQREGVIARELGMSPAVTPALHPDGTPLSRDELFHAIRSAYRWQSAVALVGPASLQAVSAAILVTSAVRAAQPPVANGSALR